MRIENNDSEPRSWFVYNYEDTMQAIALASGWLDPNGSKDWDAPKNGSGKYTVLIKRDKGGGSIMASGSGTNSDTYTFDGHTLIVT
jgi:hypothetical protein